MKITTAFHKINFLTARNRVVQGGQGAGKTYSILQIIFLTLLKSDVELSAIVVSDTFPSLQKGAIRDMKAIFSSVGMNFNEFYDSQHKELQIGNSILTFSYIDPHNIEQYKGLRYDIVYVNEATKTTYPTVQHLISRAKWFNIYDFNPDREFWIHKEILTRGDSEHISLTFKDNELLPDLERDYILDRIEESKKENPSDQLLQWVRVYAYGELGTFSERQIYDYTVIDTIPKGLKKIPYGLDVGDSPDPTSFIELYMDGVNLYAHEVFTENHLMPEKIEGAERLSVVDRITETIEHKGQMIIIDSANKTTYIDLMKHGFNVYPVKKPPGSVVNGISKMRSYKLHVTKKSHKLIEVLQKFFFKVDTDGRIIPEMDGHEPDQLAATRYVIMRKGTVWN